MTYELGISVNRMVDVGNGGAFTRQSVAPPLDRHGVTLAQALDEWVDEHEDEQDELGDIAATLRRAISLVR